MIMYFIQLLLSGKPSQRLISLHPTARNPAAIKVTVDDFSRYIASKRDFYDAMVANGYYLPRYKSSMITEEHMRDILGGRTFCPHYKDVKLLPCHTPPPVELLLRKFHRICKSRNLLNNYGVDEVHLPDKRWLLDFVSAFRPDDEIARKDYRLPRPTSHQRCEN